MDQNKSKNESLIKYKKGDSDFRPWGKWQVDEVGQNYIKKTLIISPGQQLSLQSHKFRAEHWEVEEGIAEVELDGKAYTLTAGQSIDIPVTCVHRLRNSGTVELKVLETQYGEILDENDIIRYEDIYGRK